MTSFYRWINVLRFLFDLSDEKLRGGKVSELFVYDNFSRVPVDVVQAGDICALTGLSDVMIGETVCSRENPIPLPTITVRHLRQLHCFVCLGKRHSLCCMHALMRPSAQARVSSR